MSYSDVLSVETLDDGVRLMTLNRPNQRNALSWQLRGDIADCLSELGRDDTVRAVVLTGAGEVFCAGFDLKELGEGEMESTFADAERYHHDVFIFPKPLVAAVNGKAFAGGMDLATMCDVRFAAEQAEFAQPQVRFGVPAAYDLTRTVLPEGITRDMCLSGRRLSAREAAGYGYVSQVVESDQIVERAVEFAEEIAASAAASSMKASFVASQPNLFATD